MEFDSDLNKLELNVEKLLNNLDAVQGDKSSLLDDLDRLKQENKALEDEVAKLKEEKALILSRVNSLIGNIEKWEQGSSSVKDPGDKADTVPGNGASTDPVQGVLLGG